MKNLLKIMAFLLMATPAVSQEKVGDVVLPQTLNYNEETLELNGAGIREKLWFDLYAAGLYLENKSSNASEILESKAPKAIRLHIISKRITSKNMTEAVRDGFENATGGNTAPIQKQIDQMLSLFQEDIHQNDIFDLVYSPTEGITAYKNGKKRGAVKGEEFSKALFGIWLSNRPADDDLKEGLLGK